MAYRGSDRADRQGCGAQMNGQAENNPRDRDGLEREAALWFARMRGPEAADYAAEFEQWLDAHPQNRIAYDHAAAIFDFGNFLTRPGVMPGTSGTDVPRGNGGSNLAGRRTPSNENQAWRWTCGVIAASLATMTGWWVISAPTRTTPDRTLPAAETASPSLHMVNDTSREAVERLSDGSRVTLGGSSKMTVEFGEGRRDLRLERGYARFEVAHDGRPFIVHVGGGSVRALGTVFEVARRPDGSVDVSLVRGRIEVLAPNRGRNPHGPRQLTAGQKISFMGEPTAGEVSTRRSAPEQAETPIALEKTADAEHFENVRVEDIVASANQGHSPQIVIAARGVAERRVSGWFSLTDTRSLAERIAMIYGLEIDRSDPSRLVLH